MDNAENSSHAEARVTRPNLPGSSSGLKMPWTRHCDAMIEGSAVVACPIGANRYVGVWQSVPLTMCDLQGRILRRRRRQQVAELLRLDVGQRCANSAMRARWWFSAGRAIRVILNLQNGISG